MSSCLIRLIRHSIALYLFLFSGILQAQENPLTILSGNPSVNINPHQNVPIHFKLKLDEGYKAYVDQFRLKVNQDLGFNIGQIMPAPQSVIEDKFSKRKRNIVKHEFDLEALIEAPMNIPKDLHSLDLELTYQACSETHCLFPKKIPLKISLNPSVSTSLVSPAEKKSSFFDQKIDSVLKESSRAWSLFFIFIMGFLTAFTPCIFPMIPITLSVLGKEAHARSRGQQILVSALYVLGIAFTYSILGVAAAASGKLFGSFLNSPFVLTFVCTLFFIMALSMFGLFDLEPPAWFRDKFAAKFPTHGYLGALISGVISGLVASPCVGPVLVGILTFVAQSKDLFWGFIYLFIYALGMGQLFLILGISSQATKFLPKSGPWLNRVKSGLGLLMMSASFYYLTFLLTQRIYDIAVGIAVIFTCSILGAFKENGKLNSNLDRAWKGMMQASLLIGVFFIILGLFDLRPALMGKWKSPLNMVTMDLNQRQSDKPISAGWLPLTGDSLKAALSSGRPTIVDFFADWCAACHELDADTFSNERVIVATSNFNRLKFDATNESPELTLFREKFKIVGLPTILFFDKNGNWIESKTLTEFEEPVKFMKRLDGL